MAGTLVERVKNTLDSAARVQLLQTLLLEDGATQIILKNGLADEFCAWIRQGMEQNDEVLLKNVLAVFSILPGSMPKLEHSEIDKCLSLLCSFDKNEEIQADALSLLSEWHGLDAHLMSDAPRKAKRDSLDFRKNIVFDSSLPNNFPSLIATNSIEKSPPGSPPLFVNLNPICEVKKKRVSFAPEDKLRQIREFMSDQALEFQISSFNLKPIVPTYKETPYYAPPFICVNTVERGRDSIEKKTQQIRLAPILEAIYVKIPDNPADPSSFLEPSSESRVRIIPLGDISRNERNNGNLYERSSDSYKFDQNIGKKHSREESKEDRKESFKKKSGIKEAAPCAYFITTDGCRFGDKCRYSHNASTEAYTKSMERVLRH